MFEKIPPDLQLALIGILGMVPTTFLARLLWHRVEVRAGRRERFWSKDLWWEIPTAILCAIISGGLGAYFDLGIPAANAVAGVMGWLGPRGAELHSSRFVDRYIPAKEKK